jgi:hypothetical protein
MLLTGPARLVPRKRDSKETKFLSESVKAADMAGKGNTYRHPHQETTDAVTQIGARM